MPPALGMQSLNHWIGREVPEMFSLLAGLHISLLITAGHTLLQGWSLASGDSAPPESASVPTHTGAQHFPPSPFAAATPVSRAPAAPAACPPAPPVPQTVLLLESQLQACPCHRSFPLL